MVEFRDGVIAQRGEFVHAAISGAAAHHHAACDAEALQHLGHWLGEFSARYTDELCSGFGGVEQRSQEIKQSALAAFGAELTCRANVLERRMIQRREQESEAVLGHRRGGIGR